MAIIPSNSSTLPPDDDENQLTISRVVDPNNVSIINKITYQTSFKASGINAERNSSVWIWSGNEKLGEATSNSVGEWETQLLRAPKFDCYSLFAEGRWADQPVSPTRRFTVATDTPIINEALADGEPIEDNADITATEVTLYINAIPNQEVRAFNGDALVDTQTADACGKCTIVLTDLAPGGYTIKFKSPNDKESSPFRFTVVAAGVKPVILEKLTDANNVVIPPDTTTPENALFAKGTAEPGKEVELFDGSTPLGKVTTNSTTGEYTIPTGTLADGPHTLTVVGNYPGGGTSDPITVTVKVNKPVILEKLTDANNVVIPPDTTTPENALFAKGTAEPGKEVELFDGSNTLGKVTTNSTTGEYTIPTGTLADGPHTFTVVGNYPGGGTSDPITLTVETATTAPTETRIHDAAGNIIPNGGDLAKTWLIARGNYLPNSTVQIKVNGVIQAIPQPTSDTGRWAFYLDPLTVDTVYTISALTPDGTAESNEWSVKAVTPVLDRKNG